MRERINEHIVLEILMAPTSLKNTFRAAILFRFSKKTILPVKISPQKTASRKAVFSRPSITGA
jgi:hypothetical protein